MKRRKKRKISSKKIIKILIPLIIIVVLLINTRNIITFYQSKVTGYKFDTITVFHELDIYDDIKDHKHSDTLENIITTEYYNKTYLNSYLDIKYVEKENYFSNINKLLDLGYNANEINDVYDKLKDESIDVLTNNSYLKDITKVMNLAYFKEDYLERYLVYNKDKEIGYEDLVTYVNADLDHKYYTGVKDVSDPKDLKVLVNKYNKLPSTYEPSDLEAIQNKYNRGFNNKMRHDAKVAFESMCEAALKDNITIYSGSAYRSYSYQQNLYNRYVSTNGFDEAETFSARAGYSEHQTGLATDIMNASLDYISKNDKEYTWLVNNSYKYGFILRYPEGKEKITGYMYEEWHFRYLGIDTATEVYNLGITYDEYIARQVKNSWQNAYSIIKLYM